ncbi:MAG: prolipoprotein diacylglyceryl transferase [Clostridia bacterium]|nr:prolipoprotein diacylglyceryl transferase [Clostridia bacterium]
MMNSKFLIFLALGTLSMSIPMLIIGKWYRIRKSKIAIAAVLLTISGVLGTYIWYFVENLELGGRSFYGAVFIVPVLFLFVAKLLKIPYGQLMDLCAPAECIMLVLMKTLCFMENCCAGRVLWTKADGTDVIFPSQLAELSAALLVVAILMILAYREKNKGTIYPWYLVLYGATRFILNFFRKEWVTTELFVPMGTIWSVISFAIGVGILIFRKRQLRKNDSI